MIDWATINRCFVDLQLELSELSRTPTSNELDAHYVYAQLGKSSPIYDRLQQGALSYQGSPAHKERLDQVVGQISGGTVKVAFDPFIMTFRELLSLLEEKIATHQADTQFLLAWGAVHELSGHVAELMSLQEGQESGFDRNTKSASAKTTIAQRYWYAHWVQAHQDISRPDAEDELAELCRLIRQGRRKAPKTFLPDWFSAMICQENGDELEPGKHYDEVILKTPYTRATQQEIERRIANRLVAPSDLPPLQLEQFVRSRPS